MRNRLLCTIAFFAAMFVCLNTHRDACYRWPTAKLCSATLDKLINKEIESLILWQSTRNEFIKSHRCQWGIQCFCRGLHIPQLSPEESSALESDLTLLELKNVLSSFKTINPLVRNRGRMSDRWTSESSQVNFYLNSHRIIINTN